MKLVNCQNGSPDSFLELNKLPNTSYCAHVKLLVGAADPPVIAYFTKINNENTWIAIPIIDKMYPPLKIAIYKHKSKLQM